jgi:two-component system response regulator AtoC
MTSKSFNPAPSKVRTAHAMITARADIEEIERGLFFIAASPMMRRIRAQIELLATVNVPVLILGESGSGKTLVARLIHKRSGRAAREFLRLDCGGIPPDILRTELSVKECDGGPAASFAESRLMNNTNKKTILLDNVVDIPAELQVHVLHLVQDRQLCSRTASATEQPPFRILVAMDSNADTGCGTRLRPDLYRCLRTLYDLRATAPRAEKRHPALAPMCPRPAGKPW